jgi:hypothetical protein
MRRGTQTVLACIFGATTLAAGAEPPQTEEPPAIVALTLDTSGSVGPHDLDRTRELALALLAGLPPGSQVAVLTFDDQSRTVVPRTTNADEVRKALAEAKTSGRFTTLYDALYDASRYLRDAPPARKAIVLVTDGKDENSALNLDDGLQVAKDNAIPVFAVGVGKVEEKILRRIAKLTAGEYADIATVNGGELARRILALSTPAPAPPQQAATQAPPLQPMEVPAAPAQSGRWALWLVLVGGVLVAMALLLVALARSGTAPAASLSAATDEAAAASREQALDDGPPEDEAYSPTMIGRMDTSDEQLERTITLAEKPVLIIQGGPRNGQLYILNKHTTTGIGRARANDIVLDDVSISSQHCRIRYDGGGFVLHDLKSTNGTFVNEQRVAKHALKSGDVVRLGETSLQFKLDQKKG